MYIIWDHKRADVESIERSVKLFNWIRFHIRAVHKQVSILNEILMDICSNFIPNKFVTLDDQDRSWIKDLVKTKIKLEKQ